MNVLEHASQILYERSEEKERQYGPFDKGLEITRDLANLMTNSEMSLQQIYAVIIALKLSREAFAHKEDNVLDAIVYLAQYNDHMNRLANVSECVLCGDELEEHRVKSILEYANREREIKGKQMLSEAEIDGLSKLIGRKNSF
jgi:hypothetical protein